MRLVLVAAMASSVAAAACGDAASCPSLEGIRTRMAEAPPFERSSLTVVYKADGEGRADRAIVVRLIPGADPDALKVQLDDGPEQQLWARGELKAALYAEIDAAIAGGRPRLFEVEAAPTVRSLSLAILLTDLSSRGEVRLMVAKLVQPPYARLPDWAILATQPDGAEVRGAKIAAALRRAAGTRCSPELERRMAAAMKDRDAPDEAGLRTALPDALTACRCDGADVDAAAWLYEQLMVPTLRTSWIRVHVVEGGTVISESLKEAGAMIHKLNATPLKTRIAGVWMERPF